MLIDAKVAIAIRCSDCHHLQTYETTLFQLFNKEMREINCACGQRIAAVKAKDRKSLLIEIDCPVCLDKHTFEYTLKQLLAGNITTRCRETGIEICFIVSRGNIDELIDDDIMNSNFIYKDMDFLDYFNSPDIMLKSLERIKDLDNSGLLGCSCGSKNIEMNIFQDRIELRCMKCGGMKLIYAENDDDYEKFISKDSITIHERSFECIDAINQNKDTNKK